jgi:hypothetical protein
MLGVGNGVAASCFAMLVNKIFETNGEIHSLVERPCTLGGAARVSQLNFICMRGDNISAVFANQSRQFPSIRFGQLPFPRRVLPMPRTRDAVRDVVGNSQDCHWRN